MAQNVSPDNPQTSNAKQNDEMVTVKDNHAVSKRLVDISFSSLVVRCVYSACLT